MMRLSIGLAVVVCVFLLVVDTVVLVRPLYALTCEVDCGGYTLSCEGVTCNATPGVGCVGQVPGNEPMVRNCNES